MHLGSVKVSGKRSAVQKYEQFFDGKMRLCACEACALRRVCDHRGTANGCSVGINERGCKAMKRREALRLANSITLLPYRNGSAADVIRTAESNVIRCSVELHSSELMWETILPTMLIERKEDLSERELGEYVLSLDGADWWMQKDVSFVGEWKVESFCFSSKKGKSSVFVIKSARIRCTDVVAWGELGEPLSYFAR